MAADADAAGGELKKVKTAKDPKPSAEDTEKADATKEVGVAEIVEDDEAVEDAGKSVGAEKVEDTDAKPVRSWLSPVRLGAAVGLVVVLGLGGLVGWLGVRVL